VKQFETRRATAEAERIVAKAHEAATQEHTRMLIELRGEVGRLVTRTAAAVTGKILTPDDHRRLADDTARQLSAS
jgi:F-type H+-transporting ATPase subunit b